MRKSLIHPVSLRIDADTHTRVKRLAAARHRPADWVMREAVEQYVRREEHRQSLKEEAIRAWNQYQANGRHLTHDEADQWLGTLESGKEVDVPPCHH